MQDASLSVWRRQAGQLSYNLFTTHKLVPPPSRVSNNAVVSVLCLAASVWLRCNTDPSRSTVVNPLGHTTTAFEALPAGIAKAGTERSRRLPDGEQGVLDSPEIAAGHSPSQAQPQQKDASTAEATTALARLNMSPQAVSQSAASGAPQLAGLGKDGDLQRQDQESLLVMTVSDDGHVWQWNVPLHGYQPSPKPLAGAQPTASGQAPAALPKPALLGLLHTLPHSVTTFSVCPVPVGAAWAGNSNQPSSQSGEGGDAVAVLAAVTSAGNVELITLQRGSLTPLSSAISVSLGWQAHPSAVQYLVPWVCNGNDCPLSFVHLLLSTCHMLLKLTSHCHQFDKS